MNCPLCDFSNLADVASCRACGSPLRDTSVAATTQSSEDDDALPTGAILSLGAYRVERVLGQGGFGITYLCRDLRLERAVAIKEFFPSGCRRAQDDVRPSRALSASDYTQAKNKFLEEARVLARFKHAGIVDVHTVFEENNSAYMVMEFLEGKSLLALLRERGARQMPEDEALHYIERAGDALSAVHDRGLLHRDLKPDNIIACNDGRVMLIDFGTAREYSAQQTHGHTVVVTPGYAPLEQYAQQAKRGAYTDVYGLAATLYHLLTGEVPAAASDRAMGVELVPPRELNPHMSTHVARAIETALQTETVRRPQTARAFLDLLHDTSAPQTATQVESLDATGDNGWQKTDIAPIDQHLSDADLDEMWADRKQPSVDFSALIRARKDLLQSADDAALSSQSYGPQTSDTWQAAAFGHIDQNLNLNTLSGKPLSSTNFLTGGATSWDNSQDWLFNSPQPDPQLQQSVPASDVSSAQSLAPLVPAARRGLSPTPACFKDPTPYPSSGPVGYALPPLTRFWRWLAALAFGGWIFAMSISQGRVRSPDPGRPLYGLGSGATSFGEASAADVSEAQEALAAETPAWITPAQKVVLPQQFEVPVSRDDPTFLSSAISADAKTVAFADKSVIKVWDIATRRLLCTIKQSASAEYSYEGTLLLSPDGSLLTRCNQGAVDVWDARSGALERRWKFNPSWRGRPAFVSKRGLLLPVRSGNSNQISLVLCDAATGAQRQIASGLMLLPEYQNGNGFALSPDRKTWIDGDDGGNLTWHDVATQRVVRKRETGSIDEYSDSENIRRVLRDHNRIYPFGNGGVPNEIPRPPLSNVSFSSDGKFVANSNGTAIKIFKAGGEEVQSIKSLSRSQVLFSPDNTLLATDAYSEFGYHGIIPDGLAPNAGDVKVWDRKTGRLIRLLRQQAFDGYRTSLQALVFSPDGKAMLGLNRKGEVLRWDLSERGGVRSFNPQPQSRALSGTDYTRGMSDEHRFFPVPDGQSVAQIGIDSHLRLWSMADGSLRRDINASPQHDRPSDFNWLKPSSFSADGTRVAGITIMRAGDNAPSNAIITVWDARNGMLKRQWDKSLGEDSRKDFFYPRQVALSPDGTLLVSVISSQKNTSLMEIRDVGSGKLLQSIPSSSFVSQVAFAPDGKSWAHLTGARSENSRSLAELSDAVARRAALRISLVWREARSGKLIAQRALGGKSRNQPSSETLTYLPDGTLLAFGLSGDLEVFNAKRQKVKSFVALDRQFGSDGNAISAMNVSPDGKLLAFGQGKHVHVVDVATGVTLQTLPWPLSAAPKPDNQGSKAFNPGPNGWPDFDPLQVLAFSSDSRQLRGVSSKGQWIVWNLSPLTANTISKQRRN